MESFGQKFRQVVAGSGLPLGEVADATGLGPGQIEALARDDFGSLPDDEIVEQGIRSFARLVGVDPDEVIADYRRERQRSLEAAKPAAAEAAATWYDRGDRVEWPRPPRESPVNGRTGFGRLHRTAILASASLAVVVFAFLVWSQRPAAPAPGRPEPPQGMEPVRAAAEVPRSLPGAAEDSVVPSEDVVPTEEAVPPADLPSGTADALQPDLPDEQPPDGPGPSIRQHGVGRGVVRRALVGETGRFAEGERVWFWNLIQGGAAGEWIDHVWLHEGEETRRVRLPLGGARWRTQSYKDLGPGSAGSWAVEARDQAGRILARREFSCSSLASR